MRETIKKFFIIFLFLNIISISYSINKKDNAEKYYNIAIKYYLEGNFDNAINLLTRALQIDNDNSRYAALYDLILDEKEKLKVIKFNTTKYKNNFDESINYNILINDLKNYFNKKEQQQNQKILNLINTLSAENTEIKKYQTEVIDQKISENENKLLRLSKNFKLIISFILIILFIILIIILLFFIIYKKINKIKEKIEIISLKQSEQQANLLKIEEEQKRLQSKIS